MKTELPYRHLAATEYPGVMLARSRSKPGIRSIR